MTARRNKAPWSDRITTERADRIAELDYTLALLAEIEATAGTWRGEWIGAVPADALLIDLPADAEQGALFA